MEDNKKIVINKHIIELSHTDKVYYPQSHVTKSDVIEYYRKIAPYFLSHIKDHLVVMHRFPNGITDEGFYQKQIPDYFPRWIKRKKVLLKKGEEQTLVMVDDAASLVYLANQGVLVFHSWLSKAAKANYPDKIVFDLDPSGNDIAKLRFAARKLKVLLEQHNLTPFLMTTGSRGYHVVIPIKPEHPFDKVHAFAKHIATQVATTYKNECTVEMSKEKRKGKVFVDYLRNSYGQTSVACYSLRAKEGASIATPIEWDELSRVKPHQYTIKNIFRRLSGKGDSWRDFEKSRARLDLKNVKA